MGAVASSKRVVKVLDQKSFNDFKEAPANTKGYNETDSNADTCCLGRNFALLNPTERTADVYPYDSAYEPLHNVPIASAATAWDDQESGETWLLIINEGLFYGNKLDHSLLNPNQLRNHGIVYNDNPFNKDEPIGIECPEIVSIPLETKGTKIRFESRVPTLHELNNIPDSYRVQLTSVHPWNPSSIQLSSLETHQPVSINQAIEDGEGRERTELTYECADDSDNQLMASIQQSSCIPNLKKSIISTVNIKPGALKRKICEVDVPARRTMVSTERHTKMTAIEIGELWGIGPKRAEATLRVTTQRGTRSAIMPISRRYRADRMFQVKRLNGKFATDTLFSDEKSLLQNTCG